MTLRQMICAILVTCGLGMALAAHAGSPDDKNQDSSNSSSSSKSSGGY